MLPQFHACGTSPFSEISEGQMDASDHKYQKAIDVHIAGITRRTLLLWIFLVKEMNVVTAFFAILVIGIPLGAVVLLISPFLYIISNRLLGSPTKHARFIQMLNLLVGIIYSQIKVLARKSQFLTN